MQETQRDKNGAIIYPCDWPKETQRVKELVAETLKKLQMPKLKIPVSWIESTTFWGKAFCGRPGVIKHYLAFSLTLWPYCDEEDRLDTVIHETCHVVDWELTPPEMRKYIRKTRRSHTDQWERLMWLCGRPPERGLDRPIPAHITNKYVVYCSCREYQVGRTKFASIQTRSKVYACKVCEQRLTIIAPPRSLPRVDDEEEDESEDEK